MLPNSRPVLALVPARGGSKGIPRKNLAPVGGCPLLQHTLRAALEAPTVDATHLSSDDAEILALGQRLGVNTIERPARFATDDASAVAVVEHFLELLEPGMRERDPLIVYLQPTSPLRGAAHLEAAFRLLVQAGQTLLVSVTELKKSPFKAFGLDPSGRLQALFDERQSNMRRQDLPPTYMPNGAIYTFRASEFKARAGFPSNGSVPYVMNDIDSIDVDTPEDLRRVEQILLGDRNG